MYSDKGVLLELLYLYSYNINRLFFIKSSKNDK